jgi:signal transduction histidine kinase
VTRNNANHRCFWTIPIVVFLAFLFSATLSFSDDNRIVKVGLYENEPKIFTSESGQPSGIFIDIIESIAQNEGWRLQYVHGTWGEGLDRLEKGEIDLMPDVAYSAKREQLFSFHQVPVLSSWFQVYARKGSGIQSILDLGEKRIAVLERSIQHDAFRQLAVDFQLNIHLVSLPDYQTMFKRVAKGEVDAAITNRFFGLTHARKFNLENTAVIFHPSNLFFAGPADASQPLLAAIDNNLLKLKEDPQSVYYRSLKRWVSEEVSFKLPTWIIGLGLTAGVVLLTSLVGSVVLKRQVNRRTRQLHNINRVLEQRVDERTAELMVAKERAESADRLKSSFLATMSHELRTPLNSIIGFNGIMLQELAGPLNSEQKKQLGMVQTSSRHLLSLINDVLDISKIEAGQLELSASSFELGQSIEKMVKIVSPLAEKKGIDLIVDLPEGMETVTTDQRRMEQIILNLLNNALKFTEKGHVRIACRPDHDHYLLSVADTGIGIQVEELVGLFQPFHQIDTGLSRKHEGTGLGLSICKKLLDIMGGSIDVESQWGQGSTFTIRFPQHARTGALS